MTYSYSDDLRAAALSHYDKGGVMQEQASDIFVLAARHLLIITMCFLRFYIVTINLET